MDPATVITILSAHLTLTGFLFLYISSTTGRHLGLREWGIGSVSFGVAFSGRLLESRPGWQPWGVAFDVLMIVGALLFLHGLHRFLRKGDHPRMGLAIGITMIVAHVAATLATDVVGRYVSINVQLAALYLAMTALAVEGRRAEERMPLLAVGTVFGALGTMTAGRAFTIVKQGERAISGGAFVSSYFTVASLSVLVLGFALLWLVYSRIHRQLSEMASQDPLTRVLNRAGLREGLERHFLEHPGHPLVLLQIDLDHFKRLNDQWGHAFGDRVLVAVADVLRTSVRHTDLVARTGGEEFVIASFGPPAHAVSLAERVRERVRQLDLRAGEGPPVLCSVSIGISEPFTTAEHWDFAFAQADNALYRAKSLGRDATVSFPDPAMR